MAHLALKALVLIVMFTALVALAQAQDADTMISVGDVPGVSEIPTSWSAILMGIVAAYEILARLVPTTKSYSLLGKLIGFVDKVSKYLDAKK